LGLDGNNSKGRELSLTRATEQAEWLGLSLPRSYFYFFLGIWQNILPSILCGWVWPRGCALVNKMEVQSELLCFTCGHLLGTFLHDFLPPLGAEIEIEQLQVIPKPMGGCDCVFQKNSIFRTGGGLGLAPSETRVYQALV
jgi:hypothetical protein